MRAGVLRQRVQLQQQQTTDGPLGPETSWVTVVTAWARIESPSARVRADYQSLQHAVTHEVEMRYSQVTAAVRPSTWRIVWGARYLLPVEPARDPDGRRRSVIVACQEQVS